MNIEIERIKNIVVSDKETALKIGYNEIEWPEEITLTDPHGATCYLQTNSIDLLIDMLKTIQKELAQ